MKKISIWIKKLFSKEYEIDNTPYRRLIYSFATIEEWRPDLGKTINNINLSHITKITTVKRNNDIIIKIETHRPGLIIGYHGQTIEALNDYIRNEMPNISFKIELVECQLWNNLYGK